MNFDNLTVDNIVLYIAKSYDRPNMILSEFEEDLSRFHYIKRILRKYRNTNEININLLLNHIIVLCNVFSPEVTVRSLFFKFTVHDFSILKTVLLFLNIMPDIVHGIKGNNIVSSDISLDSFIVEKLRNLS